MPSARMVTKCLPKRATTASAAAFSLSSVFFSRSPRGPHILRGKPSTRKYPVEKDNLFQEG